MIVSMDTPSFFNDDTSLPYLPRFHSSPFVMINWTGQLTYRDWFYLQIASQITTARHAVVPSSGWISCSDMNVAKSATMKDIPSG